ncbi:hypothetical protein TeGR_g1497 [Tetraparma gracilis]|uniref:Survival motor neuron interacting protein 1-domain-containing protein n=1 Tax=Tetraparma gracilis TaxID=2962635 RepID=A0ABQ6MZJ6_9STRA|nr:hypothetical protein TeGR_g1497 [Tetraparma gracilis]
MACLPVPSKRKPKGGARTNPLDPGSFASADDYLAHVRDEARGFDRVQLAPPGAPEGPGAAGAESDPSRDPSRAPSLNPSLASSTRALLLSSAAPSFSPYPSSLRPPSPAWRANALACHDSLRAYLQAVPISKSRPPAVPHPHSQLALPPMKDYIGWNLQLLPRPCPCDDSGALFRALYTAPSTRSEHDLHLSRLPLHPPPPHPLRPTPPLLLRMDPVLLLSLLSHLSRPLPHLPLPHSLALPDLPPRLLWIYALLAALPRPVHMDAASLLRTLARDLCGARAKLAGAEGTGDVVKAADALLAVLEGGFGAVGRGEVFPH